MRALTRSSIRISWPPFLTKTAIGTPQARWRDITQSGLARPCRGCGSRPAPAPSASRRWRASAVSRRRLLSRPAIGLSMAMNHCGVLRKITGFFERQRMRVLVLQLAARDQRARLDQRLDHRLVGVALLALVGEHALAGEAGRFVGVDAVLVDRVGDARVDAALGKHAGRSPSRSRSPRGRGPARCGRSPCRRRR